MHSEYSESTGNFDFQSEYSEVANVNWDLLSELSEDAESVAELCKRDPYTNSKVTEALQKIFMKRKMKRFASSPQQIKLLNLLRSLNPNIKGETNFTKNMLYFTLF